MDVLREQQGRAARRAWGEPACGGGPFWGPPHAERTFKPVPEGVRCRGNEKSKQSMVR